MPLRADRYVPETLVLGASGFLGAHIVDGLLAEGNTPRRGYHRRPRRLFGRGNLAPVTARDVRADLDDPDSLVDAMRGVDVVFHAAAHYPATSLDAEATLDHGVRQMQAVLDAAATARVRRLVYVSSTATVRPREDGPSNESDVWSESPALGVYHDLKWAMEALARAENRLEVVTACPAACLGAGDVRVGTCAVLVALARGIDVPHADGIVSIVDAADVGTAVARLGLHRSPPPRVILSGGSHRFHTLLESLSTRYHAPLPSPPRPPHVAQQLAYDEELAATAAGRRPMLSREIVDLVIHGAALDTTLAERTLDMTWAPLDKTLDRFDAWARRLGLLPRQTSPLAFATEPTP